LKVTSRLQHRRFQPAIGTNHASANAKFVKEEESHSTFISHAFLFIFCFSLIQTPLQWATRKGKGRICVDCTNGPHIEGSANTSIPKPSTVNADECLLIFYQHYFVHHIRCLWCTRITHPAKEILQHSCDDIEAALRRVLYHPSLADAFACVFEDYLIIPVGQVLAQDPHRLSSVS
jgi:hypothetical protein